MNNQTIFFENLLRPYGKTNVKLILVTHLLPDRPNFLKGLSKIVDVALIIPKPKTINQTVLKKIKKYPVNEISRDKLNQKGVAVDIITKYVGSSKFVISDIGGYFAESIKDIKDHFRERFLGVIEDTENGIQRYEKIKDLPCPVLSVARSPLKRPEDTLIAYSTVYAAERILRENNEIISGKNATVLGYGKIGSVIAEDLSRRQARVKVYDSDPMKMVRALSEGYNIKGRENSLKTADLIFAVTGNQCLSEEDLMNMKGITYIFSITSSDDEFNFGKLSKFKKKTNSHGIELTNQDAQIHLVNKGNAANFLYGGVVGEFIYLVQAEIVFSILNLIEQKFDNKISEIDIQTRKNIASIWLKFFNNS